jgi:hypothetical protein
MRRILSILVAIVLGLGPAISAVPARAMASGWTGQVDETKLPACCRRNGKHHCEMSALPAPAGETAVVAPSECCPCAPRALVSIAPASAALAVTLHVSLETRTALRTARPSTIAIRNREDLSRPKRGPPSLQIL